MRKKYSARVERVTRTMSLRRRMRIGRALPNTCVTRGMSYTHFPHNTLDKHLLDRCGRAVKVNA